MLEFYLFFTAQEYGYLLFSIITAVVLIILMDTLYVSKKKGLVYKYRLLILSLILSIPTLVMSILIIKMLIEVFFKDFIWDILVLLLKSIKNITQGG